MAEKRKQAKAKQGVPVIAVVLVIVVIVAIVAVVIYNKNKKPEVAADGTQVNQYAANAKNADDIKIKDSDSDEVKIEKIQGKLELLNKEIDEKQSSLDTETEKLNKLYEQYVSIMNESQTGVSTNGTTEDTGAVENGEPTDNTTVMEAE